MDKEEQENLNKQFIKATENSDLPLIQSLISQGADIHYNNDEALFGACQKSNLSLMKYLVNKGADIHFSDDYILRFAANNGYLEIVKYLVEKGANIHTQDDCALRWAINNKKTKIVQYFLFDCEMMIKKATKDWLLINNYQETLNLIEKRDLLLKLNQDFKNLNNKLIDKKIKKVKI